MKYEKQYQIVKITPGIQNNIHYIGRSFNTFEEAEADMDTHEPDENVTYSILQLYAFKKAQ